MYKNGCNFATEIRKDSDWDKKRREDRLESQTYENSLNHLTLFKSFHN